MTIFNGAKTFPLLILIFMGLLIAACGVRVQMKAAGVVVAASALSVVWMEQQIGKRIRFNDRMMLAVFIVITLMAFWSTVAMFSEYGIQPVRLNVFEAIPVEVEP